MSAIGKENEAKVLLKDNYSYTPSDESQYEGVSDQNKPDGTTPQTGEDNTKVKAGTPSPASVGDLTINTGNPDEVKLKMDTEAAVMPLQQQIDLLKKRAAEYTPETEEQRKKRERRERSKKIIGAVSDGLSALGNLFFTSQYAPNMYNHEKGSQLKSTIAGIERAKAEREKNNEAYYNLAMNIGNLEKERAKTVREMEAEAEARKIARQKAEDAHKAAEADRALDPYRQDKAKNDALTSGYKSVTAQAEADAAPEYYAGRNRLNDERVKTEGTKQQSNRASAYEHTQKGKNAGNGSGSKSVRSLELEDGLETYNSLENYKEGVKYWAKEYGIPTQTTIVVEKGIGSLPDKTKVVNRNIEDIAADIKRESLKRRNAKKTPQSTPKEGSSSITSTPQGDKKQWSNTANIKW